MFLTMKVFIKKIDSSLRKFIYFLETEILENNNVRHKLLPKTEMTISASHNGMKTIFLIL